MNVPTTMLAAGAPPASSPAASTPTGAGDLFAALVAALTGPVPTTPEGAAPGSEPAPGATGPAAPLSVEVAGANGAVPTAPGASTSGSTTPDSTTPGSTTRGSTTPASTTPASTGPTAAADAEGDPSGDSAPPALTVLIAAAAQAGALGIVPTGAPAAAPTPSPRVAGADLPSARATAALTGASVGMSKGVDKGIGTGRHDLAPSGTDQGPKRDSKSPAALGIKAAPSPTSPGQQQQPPAAPTLTPAPAHPTPATSAVTAPAGVPPTAAAAVPVVAVPVVPGPVVTVPLLAQQATHAAPKEQDDADTQSSAPTGPPSATVLGTTPGAGSVPVDGSLLAARGAAPSGPTTAVPVARQVADAVGDHVARLVSRGDGTRRLTLQLQPAALGDVRVVLTVRAGQVHVTLSAGAEARVALLRDAPELQRLLERVGADQPQIVVRELGRAAAPLTATTAQPVGGPTDQSNAGPGTGQPTSGQQGAQLGPGTGGQPQDRRAWMPAATSARDGGSPGTGRDDPDRPIDPATRVRTAGVDVTM